MDVHWFRLLGVLLLYVLIDGILISNASDEDVKIKIVDAPALSRFPAMSSQSKKLKLRADPSPLSGPPHLLQLRDKCYTGKEKGYTYNLCLFHNITQKEDRTGWNSFHGVLGVWHEWIVVNDTFTGMSYTLGESCGTSDREAAVMFNCSPTTKLHNFTEPRTCVYHMVLDTPLACFKGAMQVYHMLSPEQLRQWDEFDHLYYAEEITYKGLTKRRKGVLVDAGLLQKSRKEEATPAPTVKPEASPTKLTQCLQDKEGLEEYIRKLKRAVLKVVVNFPEIHGKIGLVLNATSLTFEDEKSLQVGMANDSGRGNKQEAGKGVAHEQEAGKGVAGEGGHGVEEELLLSDQVMDTLVHDLEDGVNAKEPPRRNSEEEELDVLLRDMNNH